MSLSRLTHDTEVIGYPVLPLVRQLGEHVKLTSPESAKYLHWGATTQDIMDTASSLQVTVGLRIVERYLQHLVSTLEQLAIRHKDTAMAARTHLQHAVPCTFGFKCAVYRSSLLRHLERLSALQQRCTVVQFGGAAGTLASMGTGDVGLRVRKALADELGMKDAPITWHVARDNVAEILGVLALVGGSLGKIALDFILMSLNEICEVSEPFTSHKGASSTMPQKRNPISSEVILAASKTLRANAGLGYDVMVADFERASGPWHLEWFALPSSFVIAVGALHQLAFVLDGLHVYARNMFRNLRSSKGLIVAEAAMMGLAPLLGRQTAHDVVYAACNQCLDTNEELYEVLCHHPQVMGRMSRTRILELCDPLNYLGACQLMVKRSCGDGAGQD